MQNNKLSNSYDDLEIVTTEEVKTLISDCLATGVNLLIYGEAGSGKSTIIEGLKDEYNIVQLGAASLCEEMINGIPVHDSKTNTIKYDKPDWLITIQNNYKNEPDKPQLLFIDELTLARPEVMNSLQLLLTARAVPTHSKDKLPDNVVIVSATNTVEETTEGVELSRPLKTRFMTVRMTNTPANYKRYIKSIASDIMSDIQAVLGDEDLGKFIDDSIEDFSDHWCDNTKFYGTNPRTIMNYFKMCNQKAKVNGELTPEVANTVAKRTTGHGIQRTSWANSGEVENTFETSTPASDSIYPTDEQIEQASLQELSEFVNTIKYSPKSTTTKSIEMMCKLNRAILNKKSKQA